MAEYIDREQAEIMAIDGADKWDGGCNYERELAIQEAIRRIPPADVVEVDKISEQIIRKQSEISEYWKNDVKQYLATKGYSDIEHDTDNFLRGYNEAVEDILAILDGKQQKEV